jgi:uncharacterized protein (UPF0276 family)
MDGPGMCDRFGIGWRPELAAGILANLDRIDVVEVIAEEWFAASRRDVRALETLAAQVPVVLHGVSLGLASAAPAERSRLEAMARLVERVRPLFWSEHLAFVRGGGVEIGHLAAPPRCTATVQGALANLERAASVVGTAPHVENVATLIDPPGSDRSEADWVAQILEGSASPLLLDLHNLHANANNFGFPALEFLDRIPAARIATVHLAGGKWIETEGSRRLLDDHLHDVPEPVFQLLEEVGARTPQPLTIILERDGRYPSTADLLRQLDRARETLGRGRSRRSALAAA